MSVGLAFFFGYRSMLLPFFTKGSNIHFSNLITVCRVLDAKEYGRLHRVLVINLGKCVLSLVREADRFDGDLVLSFCDSTVKEHYRSALSKDRLYKVTLVL